uniref:Nectin cell adhesion molecule 2 n=1 Tax=Chrysemys picta bellii TaxID=8478 RepID=A0A8C3HMC0_CHRPI
MQSCTCLRSGFKWIQVTGVNGPVDTAGWLEAGLGLSVQLYRLQSCRVQFYRVWESRLLGSIPTLGVALGLAAGVGHSLPPLLTGSVSPHTVVLTQRVKVRNEVTGYVGDEAMLQCLFPATSPDIKVSQVTWMKEMGGKKQNVAVYLPDHKPNFPLDNSGRIRFLNVSLQDATLIIQPLRMSDEGTYVCEFATYPHGNEDGVTTLSILARPTNTAESRKVVAGNTTIPVAVCTSANGKPPAQIKWLSTLPGNFNASEMTNGDGTVTVTSQFNMVPTAAADQQQITCVIKQEGWEPGLLGSIPVPDPPQVTIDGYDDNWYVSRSEAVLRFPAQVQGDRLVVQSVDVAVNTTFICQVTNSVGTTRVEQTVLVRGECAGVLPWWLRMGAVIFRVYWLLWHCHRLSPFVCNKVSLEPRPSPVSSHCWGG